MEFYTSEEVDQLYNPKITHRIGGKAILPSKCSICEKLVEPGGEFSFIYVTNKENYLGICGQCYRDLYLNN